jgi:2-alkyl-3-oxoalkanoate reductase
VRIFLAGATGVIGRRLVPLLVGEGHQVTGMTRARERAAALEEMGAEVAVADALDAGAVRAAVVSARPQAVIHQLSSLPRRIDPRKIERDFALNDRLRSEGTRHLVAAAQAAGAECIVAQSIAFAYAPGPPGTIHDEPDPLFVDAPEPFRRSARAVAELEETVLDAGGHVLRYGYFYGPGSSIARDGSLGEDLARRRLPIVGRGSGVWSFIHVDDAAGATAAALTRGPSGAYNVVDDDPAPVSAWLPALAQALAAPRPMRVPALVARLAAGSYGVATMTRAQGASNARARRELAWQPHYPSWREGFRAGLE